MCCLFFFFYFTFVYLILGKPANPGWRKALKPADTDWLVICESIHKLWGLRIWLPPSLSVVPNPSYPGRRGPLMFATDCLSHFLSVSLLTGPPVAPPDRKVKDTPLESKWYMISESLGSKQESAGRVFSPSWMHVNVLITRRTDWKSSGRNWMSHQVVFIVISECYKHAPLTFITHQ